MLVPMSFGELYYNDQYAFSIEYPDGWKITGGQDMRNEGLCFSDGSEQSSFGALGLWSSSACVYITSNYGSFDSAYDEKRDQLTWYQQSCNEARFDSSGSTCTDFRVISHTVGTTDEGYPTLTMKYSQTNTYPDLSSKYPMVNFAKQVYVGNDLWSIDIETDKNDFSKYQGKILVLLDSFKIPASAPIQNTTNNDNGGGGCLIATAAYGSEMAPQVQLLREIRDNQLMNTESGSAFMSGFNELYYSFSPYIADMERENPMFKEAVKLGLTPMLSSLAIMENAESESEVLGLGLSVIALNLGMYIAAPALIGIKVHQQIKSRK